MRYLSVCSGIEAATVAWRPLGWEAVAFAEIDNQCRSLLQHHYPDVPLHGDICEFESWPDANVDVLVGGTPCQSFSVAGLRGGLRDPRGNLALVYLGIAHRYRPHWVVWENVPGVLSSEQGRDFGAFLGALVKLGYRFAYRVLDAQFFGVPQRRRRVFVVGCLADQWRSVAVLFEPESLRRNPPPQRQAESQIAAPLTRGADSAGRGGVAGRRQEDDVNLVVADTGPTLVARDKGSISDADVCGGLVAYGGNNTSGHIDVATAVNACPTASGRQDFETETFVVHGSQDPDVSIDCAHALGRNQGQENAVLPGQGDPTIWQGGMVRRLTPLECERLQGFPDGYTLVPHKGKPLSDSARYRGLGNSIAVPVLRWIGERIQMVEAIIL